MKKNKLIIIISLVVGLFLSVGVFAYGDSDYGDKASKILKEISSKMNEFAKDKKAMNNGTKSLKALIKSAQQRKNDAFD